MSGDLCYGAQAIAGHLGVKLDTVYSLQKRKRPPTWREGGTICARRSTLDVWLAAREAGKEFSAEGSA